MRITIVALGSRGDIQPFVPLGKQLNATGHQVRVVTFANFAPMITGAGLDFHQLQGDAVALLQAAAAGNMLDKRTSPVRLLKALMRSYAILVKTLGHDLAAPALRDTELLLNQLPSHLYGPELSEYLGIPWAVVAVIPMFRSRFLPFIGFPKIFSPLPGYNLNSYRLAEQIGWQLFRRNINRWRTRQLGLKPAPFFGSYEAIHQAKVPFIGGFSEAVVPRQPDWGTNFHLTGWWLPDEPEWSPPLALEKFLEAGPPPVFIGFGSMPVSDPAKTTALLVEAVKMSGQRAIIQTGWAGLGGNLPPEIYNLDYAPYCWLFPRMAAIVHHGGSGTTGFGFHSGKPSLIVPFGFDQFYWGGKAYEMGVGPRPQPYRKLKAARLAEAINQAVTDRAMQAKAATLGRKLSGENGIQKAVEIIEKLK